jgi:PTH1 family peptidyl-tRNA hydrolase
MLGKPATFMNESGRFVGALARFYKIAAQEILVCFDEISLPLGRLRLRLEGSAGGQKGMDSVISHLGTAAVPRLRLGIGPQPAGMRSEEYVLAPFSKQQAVLLEGVLESAEQAVRTACSLGFEAAMNRFNKELEIDSGH